MADTTESMKFVKKLQACVKEFKKQSNETADDTDAAYFFDKGLKKWLFDHQAELDVLSTMNFDKSFMTFLNHYLFASEDSDE